MKLSRTSTSERLATSGMSDPSGNAHYMWGRPEGLRYERHTKDCRSARAAPVNHHELGAAFVAQPFGAALTRSAALQGCLRAALAGAPASRRAPSPLPTSV